MTESLQTTQHCRAKLGSNTQTQPSSFTIHLRVVHWALYILCLCPLAFHLITKMGISFNMFSDQKFSYQNEGASSCNQHKLSRWCFVTMTTPTSEVHWAESDRWRHQRRRDVGRRRPLCDRSVSQGVGVLHAECAPWKSASTCHNRVENEP